MKDVSLMVLRHQVYGEVKNTGTAPVFLYGKTMMRRLVRIFAVSIMVMILSGCGSIISRTIPGQGHGNQYYPGVQWDVRDSAWRYITILDLPFSLLFDTLLLPLDIHHGPYE